MTWSLLRGDRELKYDGYSKKCGKCFGKNDEVLESLSPLLFATAFILLTHILITANPVYEFRTGEAIYHLRFMDDPKLYSKSEKALDSLFQTVTIFSEDIGFQFGINKCPLLVMRNGKTLKSDGIQLSNDKVIKSLEEGESYKYLGVLKVNKVMINEMKIR